MIKSRAFALLFKEVNRQLESHQIIVKTGAIVDKNYSSSVDTDASWLKKRVKYHFGYKKHHVTDNEGLNLGVLNSSEY